jgi:hypothetical protein
VQRRTKKTRGEILGISLTAILAATMRAVSLRLTIKDSFDGVPVAKFLPANEWKVSHGLSTAQRKVQNRTKHIWDPDTRLRVEAARKKPRYHGPLSQKETFPAIMAARLSAVHEACPSAGYGDAADGEKDLVDGPGGLGEAELEDLLVRIDNDDRASSRMQEKKIRKSKERRQNFRNDMRTNWQSRRTMKLLNVVAAQKEKGKEGKFLIFSEFLCALDVAHAALDSCGYKVLRFDGWETPPDKQNAVQLFADTKDDHEFLLITNRSGGEGLNLQTATTVIHLTPCWNPAMTRQCNSRAIRPGQSKDVEVFHFCIMDSIEGHIYRLATEKDKKASALLDPTPQIVDVIGQARFWTMEYFGSLVSSYLPHYLLFLTMADVPSKVEGC